MNAKVISQPKQKPVKLFTQKQVAGAAAGTGILTGYLLMAVNSYRKGKKQEALICGGVGIVAMMAISLVAIVFPQIPAPIFLTATYFWAKKWYGNSQIVLFKNHVREGGEIESTKSVIGFSLISLAISSLIIFGTILAVEFLSI